MVTTVGSYSRTTDLTASGQPSGAPSSGRLVTTVTAGTHPFGDGIPPGALHLHPLKAQPPRNLRAPGRLFGRAASHPVIHRNLVGAFAADPYPGGARVSNVTDVIGDGAAKFVPIGVGSGSKPSTNQKVPSLQRRAA